jgi:hypothetical protein
MATLDQVIKPPDVLLQDLEGEAVLLNLANGQYYGLDENSFHMYKTLLSTGSIEAAYAALAQEYEVTPERFRLDFDEFVAHLMENGLIISTDNSTE